MSVHDPAPEPSGASGLPAELRLDASGAHYMDEGLVPACRDWEIGLARALTPVYANVTCAPCRRALLERCIICQRDLGGAVLLVEAGLMPLHEPTEHVANFDSGREWILVRDWGTPDSFVTMQDFERLVAEHPELVVWTLG